MVSLRKTVSTLKIIKHISGTNNYYNKNCYISNFTTTNNFPEYFSTYTTSPMSDHHLTVGSKDVPISPGKLRLYSMRFCPYSQRAHLVLDAKLIPYKVVWINLKQKPEWYFNKYPGRGVPVLQIDGQPPVFESLIICDYLDEAYPEKNKLHSNDPMRKAQDRVLVESFAKVSGPYYKCATGELTRELFDECINGLERFENELKARNTPFFSGSNPGMVDYMIWPWMERFGIFEVREGDRFALPKNKLGQLASWMDRMTNDDAVKKNYFTPEKHERFLGLFKSDDVNCFDVVKM